MLVMLHHSRESLFWSDSKLNCKNVSSGSRSDLLLTIIISVVAALVVIMVVVLAVVCVVIK